MCTQTQHFMLLLADLKCSMKNVYSMLVGEPHVERPFGRPSLSP